jgi:hypothetical protein
MASTTTSSGLTFPHPELTVIHSEPTSALLQLLKKELNANARQIHSTRGSDINGHLRILMNATDYLARTGAVFDIPVHPGNAPVQIADATTA